MEDVRLAVGHAPVARRRHVLGHDVLGKVVLSFLGIKHGSRMFGVKSLYARGVSDCSDEVHTKLAVALVLGNGQLMLTLGVKGWGSEGRAGGAGVSAAGLTKVALFRGRSSRVNVLFVLAVVVLNHCPTLGIVLEDALPPLFLVQDWLPLLV